MGHALWGISTWGVPEIRGGAYVQGSYDMGSIVIWVMHVTMFMC